MTVLRRFWFFLTRWRRLADLDEEMQLHVEMRAALNQRRGLPAAAAAREARRRFGNQLKLREESRDMWGFSELERMGKDLRYAVRTLFRTPFVTAIAIVSLALGIGATAGIFSVFHQVLVQSLAVPNPSELVNLSAPGPKPGFGSCGREGDCEAVFSYAMFRDLQKTQRVFTDVAAHVEFGANLAYEAQTSSGEGLLVSGSYFPVLELHPALGRLLNWNDDKFVGESRVVVLSYNYWSSRFGLDPTILNKQIIVNGQSLTIVGVAPKGTNAHEFGIRHAQAC